jgi:predicted nucleic acid-binding protein
VADFDLAYELFQKSNTALPRDLIHAAIMKNANIPDIFSIDGPNFDAIEGIHVVHLPELLKALELKGHYINERTNR